MEQMHEYRKLKREKKEREKKEREQGGDRGKKNLKRE